MLQAILRLLSYLLRDGIAAAIPQRNEQLRLGSFKRLRYGFTAAQNVISILVLYGIRNFAGVHIDRLLVRIVRLRRILLNQAGHAATVLGRRCILRFALRLIGKRFFSHRLSLTAQLGHDIVGLLLLGLVQVCTRDLQDNLLDFHSRHFKFRLQAVEFIMQFFV